MRQMSSKLTYFYKRVFPAVWFGMLALIVGVVVAASWAAKTWPPLPFLIVPASIALIGYVLMEKLVFDLVDEVLDDKDALIIRKGPERERVDLRDIVNVGLSQLTNPQRVTLSLRKPGTFGSEVTFCPPVRLSPFSLHPLVRELIQRIEAKRA